MELGSKRNLEVGETLDNRYYILTIVGEGGMSTVYRAKHLFLGKDVAVKVMQQHLADDPESQARFQREARACGALGHPNIVSVTEFGVAETGQPYMVMDYLEGLSLAQQLKQKGRLGPADALSIFQQICSALVHAHSKGILHRDLKPANVMLVKNPDYSLSVKLVDLGLARFMPQYGREMTRLTAAGDVLGSPCYMSPEQIRDEELDARSDVYSMGCLMFQTLTGVPPFLDDNPLSILSMHLYDPAPNFSAVWPEANISRRLEYIVCRCIEKNPAKRYQTMGELSADLQRFLDGTMPEPDIDKRGRVSQTNMRAFESGEQTGDMTAPAAQARAGAAGAAEALSKAEKSQRLPANQSGPAVDEAPSAYTMKLKKPTLSPAKQFEIFLKRLFEPVYRKIAEIYEGRGTTARTQRVINTHVLVAVLGDAGKLISSAEEDAAKYNVYYKNVEVRKSLSAQEFLVLLSTSPYDIVHLHGHFDKQGVFDDSTGFYLRLSDLQRACKFAKCKLLWLASENHTDVATAQFAVNPATFDVIVTKTRGDNFPKLLSTILGRMIRNVVFKTAWQDIVPYLRPKGGKEKLTQCIYLPGTETVVMLP